MTAIPTFRLATVLLLAFGFVATTAAQAPVTPDEQAVWASIEATWQHFADGDLDAALADYEHWHRWGVGNPALWDRDDLREYDGRWAKMGRMEELHLEPVLIQVFGEAAIAHYIAHSTFVVAENGQRFPSAGRWSDFRVRQGDRWVLVGGYRDGLCELVGEGETPPDNGKVCHERERDVSDGSWPHRTLTAAERIRYVGVYAETVASGMDPLTVRVWDEDGILHITPLAWDTWDEIHLIPMSNHEFVQGRFENGRLVKLYYPDTRVRFSESNGRIQTYEFVTDGTVHSHGTRTN